MPRNAILREIEIAPLGLDLPLSVALRFDVIGSSGDEHWYYGVWPESPDLDAVFGEPQEPASPLRLRTPLPMGASFRVAVYDGGSTGIAGVIGRADD
jgi:hypothetical protein